MNADIIWSLWVGAVIVTFAILEAIGQHKPGGTLSETLRRWLGINPPKPWRKAAAALLLAGLGWFGTHITG